MVKRSKIVIILICILFAVLLIVIGFMFLSFVSFFLRFSDSRGLEVNPIFMRTNDAKFLTVENKGKEIVYFSYFYNENGSYIPLSSDSEQFWNGSCYALPTGKFVTLILSGELYYSREIYVLFYDGYKIKLVSLS